MLLASAAVEAQVPDRFAQWMAAVASHEAGSPGKSAVDIAVWTGVELPIGAHEFGVTLLQHYTEILGNARYPTDLALRYAIPFSRLRLMIAADTTNVFENDDIPRGARMWIRVRM